MWQNCWGGESFRLGLLGKQKFSSRVVGEMNLLSFTLFPPVAQLQCLICRFPPQGFLGHVKCFISLFISPSRPAIVRTLVVPQPCGYGRFWATTASLPRPPPHVRQSPLLLPLLHCVSLRPVAVRLIPRLLWSFCFCWVCRLLPSVPYYMFHVSCATFHTIPFPLLSLLCTPLS